MIEPVTFPKEEFDRRLNALRERLDALGLRGILVSAPENVFYLTGLEHQGYFAYGALVVPVDGAPILVTRAMEKATLEDANTVALRADIVESSPPNTMIATPKAGMKSSAARTIAVSL